MKNWFQSVTVFMLVAMLAQPGVAFSGCTRMDEACDQKALHVVSSCHGSMGLMDETDNKSKLHLTNDCCHIAVNDTSTPSIKPASVGNSSLSSVSSVTENTIAQKEIPPTIIGASPIGCSSHSKQSIHCTFLI
jgi:hypothetical protein